MRKSGITHLTVHNVHTVTLSATLSIADIMDCSTKEMSTLSDDEDWMILLKA